MTEPETPKPNKIHVSPPTTLTKIWDHLLSLRFVLLVFTLSFFLKLWSTTSIRMWDEGWYADISARMANTMENGGDWAYPVYMEFNTLKMFDKPPLLFWVTGLLIILLGRTTLALKLPIAFSGAMLAVVAYYLYSGDREDRVTGVLAGLMMACAYFVNFYSRTAYIDITMVFLSSLTVLFAKRAIDLFIDKNEFKTGLTFLFLTGLVNAINLLLKAWQGLIVGPVIGIYLLAKIYEKDSDNKTIKETLKKFKNLKFTIKSSFNHPKRVEIILSIFMFSFSFIGLALLNDQLLIYSLFVFPVICILYLFFSNSTFPKDESINTIDFVVTGAFLGVFSFLSLGLLLTFIDPYNQVLEDLSQGIGSSGAGYAIIYLGLPEKLLGTSSKMLFGDILLWFLSLLGMIIVLVAFLSIISCIIIVILALLGEPTYKLLVQKNLLPILPILVLALWLAFWAFQVMLKGLLFDHEPILTVLFGLAGLVFLLTAFSVFQQSDGNILSLEINNGRNSKRKYTKKIYLIGSSFGLALLVSAVFMIGFILLYNIYNVNPWIVVLFITVIIISFILLPLIAQKKNICY